MISAEAFTYAVSGCIVGCMVGLLLSKLLYDSYAVWSVPFGSLAIIVLIVAAAVALAVYAPAKRIRNISVTETVNEL